MNLSHLFIKLLIIFAAIDASLHANVNMGIITSSAYVGDREAAWRIKLTGERLGWNVILDEDNGSQLPYEELDWTICLLPNMTFNIPCPNYLMVFHPFFYLDEARRFNPISEKYDGFLLTINDRETLKEGLERKKKEFHHVSFYPSIYSTPYKKLDLNSLVVMIPVWSNRLYEKKFKILYQMLNQSGFAKFYGVNPNENVDPQNYMGAIPFDGVSVIDVLQRHGISLVFHSSIHNHEKIPSSRIFEAAAASTVIISDENAFVKNHFGDSVFYINTNTTGKNIFKQIEKHLATIFNDPKKALSMAKKSHAIFIKNFTMEKQLLDLQAMHEEVMKKRIAE